MQSLIDNLLDLARGELRGGLSLKREATTDLEPTLRAIIAESVAAYPDRVIATKFSILHPIRCNISRMAQLFTNLLSNALTHGSKDQAIRVEAVTRDGFFELSVANAGEPIPPAALERLFRPFYRNTVGSDREGLGLGLYIAHAIATAHGGSLTVESTEDETRFTFRMPIGSDDVGDQANADGGH
jgi:phosphoserine phosphatase RsbU/P